MVCLLCAPAGGRTADSFGDDPFGVAGPLVRSDRVGVELHVCADLGEQRVDIGVVGVHEHGVRSEHVTLALCVGERGGVDEQGFGGCLLDVHHRTDLAGDLGL